MRQRAGMDERQRMDANAIIQSILADLQNNDPIGPNIDDTISVPSFPGSILESHVDSDELRFPPNVINMFGYPHEMARSMSIALERMSRIKDAQRFNEHTECIICLADFTDTDMVTPLPCDKRHFFHTKCIKEWAR